jgi:geranylgeranyl pyrophosphate synthase
MAELSVLGKIDIIRSLANTVEELVQGEWLQLEARKVSTVSRQHLELVAKKKTASLMAWCCATPARLIRSEEKVIESLSDYGECLGIAFQMIDDVIDYHAFGEKPLAQDLREGLVNFVTLELLETFPDLLSPIERLLGQSVSPDHWPWKPDQLVIACKQVRVRAHAQLESADQMLSQVSSSLSSFDLEAFRALRSILVFLRERIL